LQDKLFIYADETFWAGDKNAERVLKGLITDRVLMIEPKNVNAFQWPNRMAVYMAANEKWVVPASIDERRYAVNDASGKVKKKAEYFVPLYACIEGDGTAAMLHDLLSLDLGDWHPRMIPDTPALLEQKVLSLGGLDQWYSHLLSVAELPNAGRKNPRWASSRNLYDDAKHFSTRNTYITDDELAAYLKEKGCVGRRSPSGAARGWLFPPLAEARRAWLEQVGGAWNWLVEAPDWGNFVSDGVDALGMLNSTEISKVPKPYTSIGGVHPVYLSSPSETYYLIIMMSKVSVIININQ
jgi:hypothetical protein